ncbi:TonB-dependent receptor domain-containing protein [Aestuariibacter sp. A3R04]|uniref:TonB-dependent receptor domain-containing protein n=1 Tax=Aestuariibacter sp. A3R04 TaxID=2841571 RepID=UPI001C09AE80|nr:TonB-dependent receptor [Aestuariibacter sp. A3R04]
MKHITLVLAVSSSFSGAAYAQNEMETITVTASRASGQAVPSLATQLVISRSDIALAQVESVPELLSRYAGIDVASNGGRGQTVSVFTRGASSDQTLVLINGLRLNTASSGGATWSTLSPELIERIEIVKGPRAAIWGSDAIGGVINIITREQIPGSVSVNAKYGTNNTQSYYLGTSFSHGDGATTLAITKENSDGYDVLKTSEPDEDGYDTFSVVLNGKQNISKALSLNWMLRTVEQDSEFDSTYLNESENKNREWNLGGDYHWAIAGVTNTTTVNVGSSRDTGESYGNGREKANSDLFETRRDQLSVVNTSRFDEGLTLVMGTDQYNEKMVSNTAFSQDRRRVEGYFGHGLYAGDKITVELALRYDDVENIDGETTYNASFGYKITDDIQLSVAKGTGFKAPTFNDLYYPYGGNPNLISETSDTEAVNLQYNKNAVTLGLSFYNTDIDNLIEWAPDTNNIWQPRNIATADISGVDVQASYAGWGGTHTLNYGYLDAIDKVTNTRLVRRAKNQFSYQFTASFRDTDVLLNYEYKGDREDQGAVLDSYQIVDVSVEHHLTDTFSAKLKLHNLFNESYETVLNYQNLERAVYVSVNYRM